MIKRPVPILSLALTLALSLNGLAQTQGVAKVGPQSGVSSSPAKKVVTAENIEADVAEALSLVETNHVTGKKLNSRKQKNYLRDHCSRWNIQ